MTSKWHCPFQPPHLSAKLDPFLSFVATSVFPYALFDYFYSRIHSAKTIQLLQVYLKSSPLYMEEEFCFDMFTGNVKRDKIPKMVDFALLVSQFSSRKNENWSQLLENLKI